MKNGISTWGWSVFCGVLAFMFLLLTIQKTDVKSVVASQPVLGLSDKDFSSKDVTRHVNENIGRTVSIEGVISEVLSDKIVIVDAQCLIDEPLVVVIEKDDSKEIAEGQVPKNEKILITGEMDIFEEDDLSNLMSEDLDRSNLEQYLGHPYLQAGSFVIVQNKAED